MDRRVSLNITRDQGVWLEVFALGMPPVFAYIVNHEDLLHDFRRSFVELVSECG